MKQIITVIIFLSVVTLSSFAQEKDSLSIKMENLIIQAKVINSDLSESKDKIEQYIILRYEEEKKIETLKQELNAILREMQKLREKQNDRTDSK